MTMTRRKLPRRSKTLSIVPAIYMSLYWYLQACVQANEDTLLSSYLGSTSGNEMVDMWVLLVGKEPN